MIDLLDEDNLSGQDMSEYMFACMSDPYWDIWLIEIEKDRNLNEDLINMYEEYHESGRP